MKEKDMLIKNVSKEEYNILVEIWEASVRETHDFLTESDIEFFKPLILNEYLDAVELRAAVDDTGMIIGFVGIAEGIVEMLFITPECRGKGVGRLLLEYAIESLEATLVDVNEQNIQAYRFYKHMNFQVISRSEKDGFGKPYPLLHMRLKASK